MSLGARAASHLEEISDEGIKMMAASSTVGVVLPTTAYILKLKPPPVRKMIEYGTVLCWYSQLGLSPTQISTDSYLVEILNFSNFTSTSTSEVTG